MLKINSGFFSAIQCETMVNYLPLYSGLSFKFKDSKELYNKICYLRNEAQTERSAIGPFDKPQQAKQLCRYFQIHARNKKNESVKEKIPMNSSKHNLRPRYYIFRASR